MSENYLQALGFHNDWESTMSGLRTSRRVKAIKPPHPFSHIIHYDDPSGACITLIGTVGDFYTEALTVHGRGDNLVDVWQVMPGTAAVDLLAPDETLLTRFLAYVDDPHMYPWYPVGEVGEPSRYDNYQLGAVAVDVTVYDTVELWRADQETISDGGLISGGEEEAELVLGPQFIASYGLFALEAGEAGPEEVSPAALFKATCEGVEIVTNTRTGREWYRVEADCGFMCTLALPIDTHPAPHVGSVIDGTVLLTGTTGFWGQAND